MQNILITDDCEFDRKMMVIAMRSADCRLSFSELDEGRNALETIRETKPDLTLMDIRMPGISGFEVLRRVRDDDELRSHKVVLISGSSAPEDMSRAQKTGANAYFTKPHSRMDYCDMAQDIYESFLADCA